MFLLMEMFTFLHHFYGKATVKIHQGVKFLSENAAAIVIAVGTGPCLGQESPNQTSLHLHPLIQLESSGSVQKAERCQLLRAELPGLTGLAGKQAPTQLVCPARLAS